jgi:hypothetical protein
MFESMAMTDVDMPAHGMKFISYFSTEPVDITGDEARSEETTITVDVNEDGEVNEASEDDVDEGSERRLWTRTSLYNSSVESTNFLHNIFLIICLLGLVLLFFPILLLLKSTSCRETATKGVNSYKFNVFIRFGLVFYLPLVIACQVNFRDGKEASTVAYYLGYFVSVLLMAFTGFVVFTTTLNRARFQDPKFAAKFDTLVSELKTDKGSSMT